MKKSAKIAISLPGALLALVEKERQATGESRSEFLRRALESYLRQKRERERVEQYIRGYQKYPETAEEMAGWESIVAEAWADLPWEDGDEE